MEKEFGFAPRFIVEPEVCQSNWCVPGCTRRTFGLVRAAFPGWEPGDSPSLTKREQQIHKVVLLQDCTFCHFWKPSWRRWPCAPCSCDHPSVPLMSIPCVTFLLCPGQEKFFWTSLVFCLGKDHFLFSSYSREPHPPFEGKKVHPPRAHFPGEDLERKSNTAHMLKALFWILES